MAELRQRTLDEVKALSKDEAVEIMRQAGIVGAGGGGFLVVYAPRPDDTRVAMTAAGAQELRLDFEVEG